MQCTIRKSSNLRNAIYELGRLDSPTAVILVDSTGIKSTELFKSPRECFWSELNTVYRNVQQAYEYTLEDDVHITKTDTKNALTVVELAYERAISINGYTVSMVNRLQKIGFKRIAMICIVDEIGEKECVDKIVNGLTLRTNSMFEAGIDLLVSINSKNIFGTNLDWE